MRLLRGVRYLFLTRILKSYRGQKMKDFNIFRIIGQRILFMTFLGGYIKYFIDKDLVLSSIYFILAVICFVTLPIGKSKKDNEDKNE